MPHSIDLIGMVSERIADMHSWLISCYECRVTENDGIFTITAPDGTKVDYTVPKQIHPPTTGSIIEQDSPAPTDAPTERGGPKRIPVRKPDGTIGSMKEVQE